MKTCMKIWEENNTCLVLLFTIDWDAFDTSGAPVPFLARELRWSCQDG